MEKSRACAVAVDNSNRQSAIKILMQDPRQMAAPAIDAGTSLQAGLAADDMNSYVLHCTVPIPVRQFRQRSEPAAHGKARGTRVPINSTRKPLREVQPLRRLRQRKAQWP